MVLHRLLRIFISNGRLTRRQACQIGGILGLSVTTFGPFWQKAFARKDENLEGESPMHLPAPILVSNVSVDMAIQQRRTIRSFMNKALTLEQFSQILWAAQGVTEGGGFKRAAPSAGALYPADVYAVVGDKGVAHLTPGIYHYHADNHSTEKIAHGDRRSDVAEASLKQTWMATAAVMIVITAQYSRITSKYGDRGFRYALIEVGHIGQNIFLQCQALGLAAGIVGAFRDRDVARAIHAQSHHEPLVIMPVGWKG